MEKTKKQKRLLALEIVLALLVIGFVVYAVLKWLFPALLSEPVQRFIEKIGVFGPLIIILYFVVSHVLAPMSETPGLLLASALFGIPQALFYTYIGTTISAVVSFWISRKLGRKWVEKLSGRRTMKEIDSFVASSGLKILIISRIFGFAVYEVISYAAGLTKIKFSRYLWITVVFSAIPAFVFGFLFRNADLQSTKTLVIWLSAIIASGLLFAFLIRRYIVFRRGKE